MEMDLFYCKDINDIKKAAIHIFKDVLEYYDIESALLGSRICKCSYCPYEIDNCQEELCDEDICFLCNHLEDKNVWKNIELNIKESIDFPCIIYKEETEKRFQIYSISKAKENTKYGV